VAPGHEKAFPAGNPKVLAIVGVFPFFDTALVTFLSIERFSMGFPFCNYNNILIFICQFFVFHFSGINFFVP
jgi:hypothetical protein